MTSKTNQLTASREKVFRELPVLATALGSVVALHTIVGFLTPQKWHTWSNEIFRAARNSQTPAWVVTEILPFLLVQIPYFATLCLFTFSLSFLRWNKKVKLCVISVFLFPVVGIFASVMTDWVLGISKHFEFESSLTVAFHPNILGVSAISIPLGLLTFWIGLQMQKIQAPAGGQKQKDPGK